MLSSIFYIQYKTDQYVPQAQDNARVESAADGFARIADRFGGEEARRLSTTPQAVATPVSEPDAEAATAAPQPASPVSSPAAHGVVSVDVFRAQLDAELAAEAAAASHPTPPLSSSSSSHNTQEGESAANSDTDADGELDGEFAYLFSEEPEASTQQPVYNQGVNNDDSDEPFTIEYPREGPYQRTVCYKEFDTREEEYVADSDEEAEWDKEFAPLLGKEPQASAQLPTINNQGVNKANDDDDEPFTIEYPGKGPYQRTTVYKEFNIEEEDFVAGSDAEAEWDQEFAALLGEKFQASAQQPANNNRGVDGTDTDGKELFLFTMEYRVQGLAQNSTVRNIESSSFNSQEEQTTANVDADADGELDEELASLFGEDEEYASLFGDEPEASTQPTNNQGVNGTDDDSGEPFTVEHPGQGPSQNPATAHSTEDDVILVSSYQTGSQESPIELDSRESSPFEPVVDDKALNKVLDEILNSEPAEPKPEVVVVVEDEEQTEDELAQMSRLLKGALGIMTS